MKGKFKSTPKTGRRNHSPSPSLRKRKKTSGIPTIPSSENRDPLKLYRAVLIGKPNVGKSSLLNVLTHSDSAIITRVSGTTRDSINRVMKRGEEAVMMSDLPGWDESIPKTVKSSNPKIYQGDKDRQVINPAVFHYLRQEVEACDILIIVTDITDITVEDRMILDWVRAYQRSSSGKAVLYCANKCDDEKIELAIGEVYEAGGEEVIPVSSKMKRGLSALMDAIFRKRKELIAAGIPTANPHVFYPTCDYKLAIVGKPNAGKSSLFNSLLNKERAVVSEVAGTTRDLVEDFIIIGAHTVRLIDTGGLRRKSREKTLTENFSVRKAVHAVTQSDVVILVIDAVEKLSDQDKKIISLAQGKKKSLVVALNKWDLVKEKWEEYYQDLLLTFPPIKEFPLIPISCANRKNLVKLLKTVDGLYGDRSRKIGLEELNRSLKRAGEMRSIAGAGGGVRIRYAMQVQNHPPVFYIYVSNLNQMKSHFRKYIYNYLENLYDLKGTPLTLRFFDHRKPPRNHGSPSNPS